MTEALREAKIALSIYLPNSLLIPFGQFDGGSQNLSFYQFKLVSRYNYNLDQYFT